MLLSLLILEKVLDRQGPWGVTALADALGLPKARIHRHLGSLKNSGFLSQDAVSRSYEPGWRLLLLGQRIESRTGVVALARPVMARLRDEVGQSVVLSQLTEQGVTVTEVLPGGSPIDVVLSAGTQLGYNSSAQGKVALAFGIEEQVRAWSALPPEQRTAHTITDPQRLHAELDKVHDQGWASGPQETFLGVNTLAAPVFSHGGALACTLGVVASIHYLPDPPDPALVSTLTTAAASLSWELGYRTDYAENKPAGVRTSRSDAGMPSRLETFPPQRDSRDSSLTDRTGPATVT
ncbi:IclR family transcriptional regulator [Rhodococcus wratislaviensis]|nr:IclR family transcriptional regulator [Rhodococcus wratislaviensis]